MFKKIFIKTHTEDTQQIEALETWVVKWKTFQNGQTSLAYVTPKFQCFADKNMAETFAQQIRDAYKLIGTEYRVEVLRENNGL